MDSRSIQQLTREIEPLLGSRLDRIGQPRHAEVHLTFRQPGVSQRLVVSLRRDLPRAHFTSEHPENLRAAPAMSMALRRHLEGSRLVAAACPRWERYFTLRFASRNRLGDPVQLDLVVELIPRASNLSLVTVDGQVLVSWKHRPGEPFALPAEQPGIDPEALQPCHLPLDDDAPVWRALMRVLRGFGPLMAKEAVYRAGLAPDSAGESARAHLPQLVAAVHQLAQAPADPAIYYQQTGEVHAWHAIRLEHLAHLPRKAMPSAQQAAEWFYRDYLAREALGQRQERMQRVVTAEHERTVRKLDRQLADAAWAQEADDLKLWGELLYAQAPSAVPGVREVEVVNYYSPEQTRITIPLDPRLSVKDNARHYFERYNKALRTRRKTRVTIEATQNHLDYLVSLAASLEVADTPEAVEEIWEEMEGQGLVRRSQVARAHAPRRAASFAGLTFRGPAAEQVWVGRNHRQNEQLVRMARPDDLWLHARGVPGAHVLVRPAASPPPPGWPDPAILEMAAELAAYYSKAAGAQRVDVDWTWAKYVRRPPQARPGMVNYEGETTLRVQPRAGGPSQSPG